MDEDAMFKALLKNKSQQQKNQVPVTHPVDTHKNSEDAMFKVLLRNNSQQQTVQNTPVRTDVMQDIPAVQAAGTYEKQESIMQAELIAESIKNLTIGVDRVHGLLKTLIAPVLVLILIVGIAVLILLSSQIMF